MTVCWRRPQQHDTLKRRYDCRHGNRIFQLFNYTEKLATLVSYSIPTIWQPFRRKLRVGTISSAGTYGALSLLFSSSVGCIGDEEKPKILLKSLPSKFFKSCCISFLSLTVPTKLFDTTPLFSVHSYGTTCLTKSANTHRTAWARFIFSWVDLMMIYIIYTHKVVVGLTPMALRYPSLRVH